MENLAGKHIKGYELKERIAAGGFGAVYRAQQSTVGREVAVKIILPGLANQPDFIRRFEAEAQLIARLEHHFIVPLYDYWRDPDGAYLVMRYLRGGSLHDHILKHGSISIEESFNLFSQVAQGLHIAHRNQVVHRDIKPGNILLDEDGTGFLADFGIAKDHTSTQNITEADSYIGSPEYLAPEQVRNEPVTPQTDIYSLGVVLYEMLVGEHPFPSAEQINYIFNHLNEALPEITTLDDRISDEVNTVIQKATAKDPKQRFSDVLDMLAALRQAAQLDVTPTPSSVVELLTPREQEVMQLIIDGKSNREIADSLVLVEGTVKTYITNIYRKLRVRSRVQAIARARDLNFVVGKPGTSSVSTGHLPEPVNPYKGLKAFQAADIQDFFGREKLTQKLLGRLQEHSVHHRFLAIVGPSGSGKSSVVKAGLIPALWRGDLPGSENWYIVDLLPGAHPLDELEIALLRVAGDNSLNLRDQLARDVQGLHRVANLILPDDGSELLLVIDQFEEVFTLLEHEAERLYFLNMLREAVADKRSRVRVVVTLRADYYDRPLQYPDFGELIRSRVETVLPLGAEELERAVTEPARRAGIVFEDGLVSRIVSDVHYQPGALPLLQYALTELFERRDGRKMTLETYETIGGTGGALAKRADEIYLEGNDEGREQVRQLFLRLVTLGEGAEDTRRRVNQSELLDIASNSELMDEIIDLYANSRLLSLDNDPSTRQPTVELAHEAILREWDRLRAWLNESRDDIRQERLMAQAADAWEGSSRDTSYLLSGSRLEQAEKWRESTELALSPVESDFIQASVNEAQAQERAEAERNTREEAQRKRSRTLLRALVAVFAVATVLSMSLAILANSERSRAETAEQDALIQASIGLAALVEQELERGELERSVLLALENIINYPFTPQAQAALVRAVDEYHPMKTLEVTDDYDFGENFITAAWSPDGKQVMAGGWSSPNTTVIWDLDSGKVLLSLDNHRGLCDTESYAITAIAWSPTGHRIATIAQDIDLGIACGVVIWDAATGANLLILPDAEIPAYSLSWSPDEKYIVVAYASGAATIWDSETGSLVTALVGHSDEVYSAKWSPDGQTIATASADGTIRLWDASSGQEKRVMTGYVGAIRSLAWSPDGSRLVSGGDDALPRIWDVSNAEPIVVLRGHTQSVEGVDWSPDGRLIASVSDLEGIERIWDAGTGAFLLDIRTSHSGYFSPDSQQVLTHIFREFSKIFIWNISSNVPRLIGHSSGQEAAAWSPDNRFIATWGDDDSFRIWNAENGAQINMLKGINARYGSWSPDSANVIIPDSNSNIFHVWNVESSEISWTLSAPDNFADNLAPIYAIWSPDGAYIAGSLFNVNTQKPIYIWDAESHETVNILVPDDGDMCMQWGAEWSPDSRKIVSGCLAFEEVGRNTPARIRDAVTGEELLVLASEHGWTMRTVWSPDGTRMLVTYEQGMAEIWDTETGAVLQTFAGHTGTVWGADWSPDGTFVVTGDSNGVVKIWHSQTGEEVASYVVPGDALNTRWSPDGASIIITGDATIEPVIKRVWLSTEALIAYAYDCCVTRDLTLEERSQFGLLARAE